VLQFSVVGFKREWLLTMGFYDTYDIVFVWHPYLPDNQVKKETVDFFLEHGFHHLGSF
jgi:hypothetical protein